MPHHHLFLAVPCRGKQFRGHESNADHNVTDIRMRFTCEARLYRKNLVVVLAEFWRAALRVGALAVEGDRQADDFQVAARQRPQHVHRLQLFSFRGGGRRTASSTHMSIPGAQATLRQWRAACLRTICPIEALKAGIGENDGSGYWTRDVHAQSRDRLRVGHSEAREPVSNTIKQSIRVG
jgi:hypothetical protein